MATQTPDSGADFVASVLRLRPRLAVFDCDGTLWSLDSGEQFLYWELERGLLPAKVAGWISARYDEYKAGKIEEEPICGEMVTIHAGISQPLLERAAAEFFTERVQPHIFPDMQELTRRLAEAGCEMWAVSSTNDWVVRAGVRRFGIAPERVIAACVHIENGRATGRLVHVPTGPGKATALRELTHGAVDAAFGNSVHDAEMLALATHAFAINPNPDLEEMARARGWTVYFPQNRNRG